MAKQYEKEVKGWITRGGKHIPLYKDYAITSDDSQKEKGKFKKPDAKTFYEQFNNTRELQPIDKRWRVAQDYGVEDYEEHERFMAEDGSVFSIHDGDIVSVCTVPKDKGGTVRGSELLKRAVKEGGNRLDAYGEYLYHFYTKNGFEPVSVCRWEDEYAPDDWKRANGFTNDEWKSQNDNNFKIGREDIIFYKYTGNTTDESYREFIGRVGYSQDYDEAMSKRDKEINL